MFTSIALALFLGSPLALLATSIGRTVFGRTGDRAPELVVTPVAEAAPARAVAAGRPVIAVGPYPGTGEVIAFRPRRAVPAGEQHSYAG